jgi:hypothetical protein
MYKSIPLFLIISVAAVFLHNRTPSPAAWHPVFQNDLNGHTLYGNKQDLLKAVRQGTPVRVAWGEKLEDGTSDVEFSNPDFTTLVNDSDLVVQFPVSMIQTDYMNAHRSFLKTNPPTAWKALMCTDGHYHQFHYELKTGEVSRIMFLRAAMTWYVFEPGENRPADNNDRQPNLTIPDGIVLDSMVRK